MLPACNMRAFNLNLKNFVSLYTSYSFKRNKQKHYKETKFSWEYKHAMTGITLETEGSVQKIQKGGFFTTKKLKRAPLIWPPPMFIASLQLFW